MAGEKISALPPVPSAQLTDIFPIVQSSTTYKETIAQLVTLINSPSILTGFLPLSGGTMTGNLILNADPTLPLQAATKEYVDLFATGITVILSAAAATTANLNATPAGAGVGATLTNAGAMAAFAVDGYSASSGDRILVKNQTLTQHNGIYTVTTVGSGAVNWVLTRATDYDQPSEIKPGTLIAVNNGTVNATTSWLETATVVTVDTDPVLFSQFTFGPSSFLLKANNLSDLASVATALVNLGLGTPTGTGNVVLQTSPTLITPDIGVATGTSFNGITGIASKVEQNTATDITKVVTPGTQYSNPAGIKAWANFTNNGAIAVQDSYNINAIVRLAGGQVQVTLNNAMLNATYVVQVEYMASGQTYTGVEITSTTQFTIRSYDLGGAADINLSFIVVGHGTA